jgi:putative acetyltransferase
LSVDLRKIKPHDDPGVANVIRTVMPEFGANGPGFAIGDPEVDSMHASYSQARSSFYVLVEDGLVVGCGGVALLSGTSAGAAADAGASDAELVCELRKMYFFSRMRGKGYGQKLMDLCLSDARKFGFTQCYIETLESMKSAQKLYLRNGFRRIEKPMGNTGHFSCDTFYLKELF